MGPEIGKRLELEGSKLTERQKLASVEVHSSLRSGLQDAGAYLVVEQLAEPTEHCRENHVSTKDPHEKDSPGALPTKTENKSLAGHSPVHSFHAQSRHGGLGKGQGSPKQ